MGDVYSKLSIGRNNCGSGLRKVATAGGANGDVNEGAGGYDLFLCHETTKYPGSAITNLVLSESSNCKKNGNNWKSIGTANGANGDFNQDAGGEDVFLCHQD